MKQKKFKKLSLNKTMIASLDQEFTATVRGGGISVTQLCTDWTCESNVIEWCTWNIGICAENSISFCPETDL